MTLVCDHDGQYFGKYFGCRGALTPTSIERMREQIDSRRVPQESDKNFPIATGIPKSFKKAAKYFGNLQDSFHFHAWMNAFSKFWRIVFRRKSFKSPNAGSHVAGLPRVRLGSYFSSTGKAYMIIICGTSALMMHDFSGHVLQASKILEPTINETGCSVSMLY